MAHVLYLCPVLNVTVRKPTSPDVPGSLNPPAARGTRCTRWVGPGVDTGPRVTLCSGLVQKALPVLARPTKLPPSRVWTGEHREDWEQKMAHLWKRGPAGRRKECPDGGRRKAGRHTHQNPQLPWTVSGLAFPSFPPSVQGLVVKYVRRAGWALEENEPDIHRANSLVHRQTST